MGGAYGHGISGIEVSGREIGLMIVSSKSSMSKLFAMLILCRFVIDAWVICTRDNDVDPACYP